MRRNEKGFTLMELMVVIVIVAILAAVAVPLYINYVKDAQRTEAKAAIGAISTAEQAYFLKMQSKYPGVPATYGTLDELEGRPGTPLEGDVLLNIEDAKVKWTFQVTADATGYTVIATYTGSQPVIGVTYTYAQGEGGVFTDQ